MFRTFVKVRHASVLADPYPLCYDSSTNTNPRLSIRCWSGGCCFISLCSAICGVSVINRKSAMSRPLVFCSSVALSSKMTASLLKHPFMPPAANHTKSDMKCVAMMAVFSLSTMAIVLFLVVSAKRPLKCNAPHCQEIQSVLPRQYILQSNACVHIEGKNIGCPSCISVDGIYTHS